MSGFYKVNILFESGNYLLVSHKLFPVEGKWLFLCVNILYFARISEVLSVQKRCPLKCLFLFFC